jgi:DNA-binding beta-propeller fold protein YncE
MTKQTLMGAALAALFLAPAAGLAETSLKPITAVAADEKGVAMERPEGIGCAGKSVVVADTGNGRLLRFEYHDESVSGGKEIRLPQLPSPLRVQLLDGGDLLVLDGKLHKLARLAADGSFRGYIAPSGVPAPEPVVRAFRADAAGNLYLLDLRGERVVVVDPAGKFLREVPFPKAAAFVADLAVTPSGDILIVDAAKAILYRLAKDGKAFAPLADLREKSSFPASITVDRKGTVYVLDENEGGIIVVGADGAFLGRRLGIGVKKGLLSYPAQACSDGAGNFFVADRGNNRFQVFLEVQ